MSAAATYASGSRAWSMELTIGLVSWLSPPSAINRKQPLNTKHPAAESNISHMISLYARMRLRIEIFIARRYSIETGMDVHSCSLKNKWPLGLGWPAPSLDARLGILQGIQSLRFRRGIALAHPTITKPRRRQHRVMGSPSGEPAQRHYGKTQVRKQFLECCHECRPEFTNPIHLAVKPATKRSDFPEPSPGKTIWTYSRRIVHVDPLSR